MRKDKKARCSLCGRELGKSFKKIIVREKVNWLEGPREAGLGHVEVRGSSQQLFTLCNMDLCAGCMDRFDDFQERCRLSADE